MTIQEQDDLEAVLSERKLSKKVFDVAGDLCGSVSQLPLAPGKSEKDMDERLFGSRSYLFVNVSECMLYSQLEVTTRSQAKQQIILLQVRFFACYIIGNIFRKWENVPNFGYNQKVNYSFRKL